MHDAQHADRRKAVVFPKAEQSLEQLGENIRLAAKRRGLTQTNLAERTGLSRLTVRRIGRGDPGVSIGHYAAVLNALNLSDDLSCVARDDTLGRKLMDIELLRQSR